MKEKPEILYEADVAVVGGGFPGVCAAVGQAAGVVGAVAAKREVHPRMLDVDPVRSELRRQGAKVD